jgi:hypothetical protein
MPIHIDAVVSSRIKSAWGKLSPDQRNRIAPLLAKANQQALSVAQTKAAPVPDPTVPRQALLAHSALTDDQDGVLSNLEPAVVIDIDAGGDIWGTGKYEQLDPGWAECIAVWLEHLILGKHAFSAAIPPAIQIPDEVQIGLAGDWGTGDWRTVANPAPSTDVRHHLAFLQPHLTIHLGDVYYSGTSDQEQHLLVKLWPTGSLGALTLNSNHEMYCGAKPYFQEALGSPLFAIQQQHSFFALENAWWVIVGLDSAYYADAEKLYSDGSLQQDGGPTIQVDFLRAQVAKGKKLIVLTHHNGLSDDGSTRTTLWTQVMSAFADGTGPAYWYWGHVHVGAVYNASGPAGVLCRCCGHGALPMGPASDLAKSQGTTVAWYETRSAHDPEIPQRVLNGFAVLRLEGPNLVEIFYDENGGVAWQSV